MAALNMDFMHLRNILVQKCKSDKADKLSFFIVHSPIERFKVKVVKDGIETSFG